MCHCHAGSTPFTHSTSSTRTAAPGQMSGHAVGQGYATPVTVTERLRHQWATPSLPAGSPMDVDASEDSLEQYRSTTPGTMTKRLVGPVLQGAIYEMEESVRGVQRKVSCLLLRCPFAGWQCPQYESQPAWCNTTLSARRSVILRCWLPPTLSSLETTALTSSEGMA